MGVRERDAERALVPVRVHDRLQYLRVTVDVDQILLWRVHRAWLDGGEIDLAGGVSRRIDPPVTERRTNQPPRRLRRY